MLRQKRVYIILCVLSLGAVFFLPACKKEYSYEGGPITAPVVDTLPAPVNNNTGTMVFPKCAACDNVFTGQGWHFKVGTSTVCGTVTKAVLSAAGDAMTFFGPSSCSADSGLIITAYFKNDVLLKDQKNITASFAALEYYDNKTKVDVLQSVQTINFYVTIDSYQRQTGLATGTFYGLVLDKNNAQIKVESGSFSVIF